MPRENIRRPARGKGQALQATPESEASNPSNAALNLNESMEGSSSEKLQSNSLSQEVSNGRNSANLIAGSRRTRGGQRGSTTVAPSSRFKPKNVRRSAIELADIAKKEEIRKAAAVAEYARQQARLARGRGRQRGRGDMMGQGRGTKSSANSIFGIAPEGLKKDSGMLSLRSSGVNGSGGGGPSTTISFKKEGHRHDGSSKLGSGERNYSNFAPHYPGEDEDVIRVDIENINLISEDEDEDEAVSNDPVHQRTSGTGRINHKSGLRPVRLLREEHKERATIVKNTSVTISQPTPKPQEDLDEGLFVTDGSSSFYKKEVEDIATDTLEIQIKQEPTLDEISSPSIISHLSKIQTKDSLISSQNIHDALNSSTSKIQPHSNVTLNVESERGLSMKKGQFINKNLKRFVIQSEEDRAEYERHLGDLEILANELGSLQKCPSMSTQNLDDEKSIEKTEELQEERDKKEGRLYLFQFPPVLPPLFNPLSEEKLDSDSKVKNEFSEADPELEILESSKKGKSKAKETEANTQLPSIKLEVEDEPIDQKKNITERTEIIHEEGFIGKLLVRESGRVELCWGGTRLLVGRGVDAKFLTTGVILDNIERGPVGGGVPEGKAFGMGQIMGKFVVTPDWMSMI